MKSIIIYYSRKGHILKIKDMLVKELNLDSCEVIPSENYGGYLSSVKKVIRERKNKEIINYKNKLIDINNFDVIFVGFPIWFNEPPSFFLKYLKDLNMKNKIIIPFANAGGSSIKNSSDLLKKELPHNIIKLSYYNNVYHKENFNQWVMEIKGIKYGI